MLACIFSMRLPPLRSEIMFYEVAFPMPCNLEPNPSSSSSIFMLFVLCPVSLSQSSTSIPYINFSSSKTSFPATIKFVFATTGLFFIYDVLGLGSTCSFDCSSSFEGATVNLVLPPITKAALVLFIFTGDELFWAPVWPWPWAGGDTPSLGGE